VRTSHPAVIGPAASVIEVEAVRDSLASPFVAWLTGPVERLAADAASKPHRPFLADQDPLELLTRQMAVREPLVLPIADLVIDVYTMSKDQQADAIVTALGSG
jgi:shikimate kinase